MGLGLTTARGGASDEKAVVGATSEDYEIEAWEAVGSGSS